MWYNDYWINEEGGIFTKIHLNGYLKDITNNTKNIIDTTAIKTKNRISYQDNQEQYTIHTSSSNQLILNRKTDSIDCTLYFEENKIKEAIYYIKGNDLSLEIKIRTNHIKISDNSIKINYTVIDSDNDYEYNIEMSE